MSRRWGALLSSKLSISFEEVQPYLCFTAYYHDYHSLVLSPSETTMEIDVQPPSTPFLKRDEEFEHGITGWIVYCQTTDRQSERIHHQMSSSRPKPFLTKPCSCNAVPHPKILAKVAALFAQFLLSSSPIVPLIYACTVIEENGCIRLLKCS
ncbi:uncharacterized protein J3R85_009319 [Psidium guajava]|nr:uncharacterized protein J3R85_009319 [Psidium guajava]